MIEIARSTYFFVRRGEIVHTPRRFGSDKRLSGCLGDESNNIKTEDLVKTSESSANVHADNRVIFDVGSMDDTQFESLLKKIK